LPHPSAGSSSTSKLAHLRGDHLAIRENPPTIFHWRKHTRDEFVTMVEKAFSSYRASLPIERRVLVDRFEFKDIAIKVVGVGCHTARRPGTPAQRDASHSSWIALT
jgi:hypothetical protein